MKAKSKMLESANAFDAWWRGLTRKGDPALRPDLVREAFHAGYTIAKAEGPAIEAGDDDEFMGHPL